MRHCRTVLLTALLAGPASSSGQAASPPVDAEAEPADRPGGAFSLTVYSGADPAHFDPRKILETLEQVRFNGMSGLPRLPGFGVVREVRRLVLAAGENTVRFTGVASGIDPTTVSFRSLTAPDSTAVLEQDYQYDLVSAVALLKKFQGRPITLHRRLPSGTSETLEALLLAYEPEYNGLGRIVARDPKDKQSPLRVIALNQDLAEIRLADAQGGLVTRPTLVWKVEAERAGPHDVEVTYQTDGLTWRADYNVIVNADDTAADLGAWVSLLNESGASYPDARLKLVAGDVQHIDPDEQIGGFGGGGLGGGMMRGAPAFREKSFFEYHLYSLDRVTSLANHSTKQLQLFPTKAGVPITKVFVYYGLPKQLRSQVLQNPAYDRELGQQGNTSVDIYFVLKNRARDGLGLPLPAGRLRVYKRDEADAALEFIGEDVLPHTPRDEQVMARLGTAFDLVGERRQTDFQRGNSGQGLNWMIEKIEITLRNHRREAARVIVKENLFRWLNWRILPGSAEYQKQDSRTVHIPVEVPADGETTVTYSVKYTW